MRGLIMALSVILSGCNPYIPEPRTREGHPVRDRDSVRIDVDTTTRAYGYEFVIGKAGGHHGIRE